MPPQISIPRGEVLLDPRRLAKRGPGRRWAGLLAVLLLATTAHPLSGKSETVPPCRSAAVSPSAQASYPSVGYGHSSYTQRQSRAGKPRVEDPEESSAHARGAQSKRVEKALESIKRGPPFPYKKDGTVFRNAEGKLPRKPRGYYREYTVPPPRGTRNRGAERLVVGKGDEVYYTGDHYRTFQRIK